jgi:nitroreductase
MNQTTILSALNWRYAGKQFDTTKTVSEEHLHTILESGRLSPSAFGVEPWQFIVVKNTATRTALRAASYDQPKVTDASYIIVIATRTDGVAVADDLIDRTARIQGKTKEDLKGLSDMVHGAVTMKGDTVISWLASQTYIALGTMIETAALLGIDSGPMEGFDANKVDKILGLKEKNLHAVTMLALGYRGDDMYATLPKVRREFNDVVTVVE